MAFHQKAVEHRNPKPQLADDFVGHKDRKEVIVENISFGRP